MLTTVAHRPHCIMQYRFAATRPCSAVQWMPHARRYFCCWTGLADPATHTAAWLCCKTCSSLLGMVRVWHHYTRTAATKARTDDLQGALHYLQEAAALVDCHGAATCCEGGTVAMLTWFASTAWNAGKAAADSEAHSLASCLFEQAAKLFGTHPELEPSLQAHEKVQQRMKLPPDIVRMSRTLYSQLAYLLAAALALEGVRSGQDGAGNGQQLQRIQAMLTACRGAADKYAPPNPDPSLEFCMLLVSTHCALTLPQKASTQEFEVAVHLNNVEAQLAAVQRLQHLSGVHTHTLLRCASMPHATPCGTVLAAVYAAALAVELQRAEPDVAVIAAVCTMQKHMIEARVANTFFLTGGATPSRVCC